MQKKADMDANEHLVRNHHRRIWTKVVIGMACLVVFLTTYALILPAITMDKTTCGLEEHVHTDECYTESPGTTQIICSLESLGIHSHTDSCYDNEDNLICGHADFVVHTHDENCYDSDGNLICPLPEIKEHVHTAACFDIDGNLICEEPVIELHTHTADCYTDGVLTCGKTEILQHQHTPECVRTEEGTGELTCGKEEHTHTAECYSEGQLSDPDQERVDQVIQQIDALPTSDEIEEQLTSLENESEEAYEEYLTDISLEVRTVYAAYEDLEPELQEYVTNADKLMEMEWLWSASTMAITDNVTVFQVNTYSQAVTTLIQGGSVSDKLGSGMSYTYWDVIVVEKDSTGRLYVEQYVTADGDKCSYKASTTDGFVLLLYNMSVNASVGQTVTVDFDYKATGNYNSAGYGTVTFGTEGQLKAEKDNSDKLTIVQGADTRDLIEVNLYDYNSSINTLYNSNHKYPGFQQDRGSQDVGDSFSRWASFNFGNNITSDLAAGIASVTNQGGDINKTTNGANSPISDAMQTTLGSDGYPALSDGTSLGYLFSNSAYAAKQNSQSINGLFQYNDTTGAYTFNSRENHAQFNPGSDTFTLYDQIISSNFMMYPFGNFLPFNDIVKQSAQASTIDRAYLQTIADSSQYKYSQGYGAEYGTLSTQLNKFIGLMDAKYGTGWKASDAMNEYFNACSIPRTFSQDEALVQKLYSIDYDEPTDFYFGMEMKMEYMQPKGGLTGKDGKQPMVFYFTGDDDVWVYIDGKLFLDLSGIHRHVGGEIDFVNGVVKYYDLDVSTGDVSTTPSKTVKFSEILGDSSELNEKGTYKDYSKHTFNFYYMERGAGSGVCRMNFNFPLLKKNSISVTKELSVDEADKAGLIGNPDFKFQVLKEGGDELFIGADTEYEIYDTSGIKTGSGKTDANGVFTLKANQTAVFSGIEENAGKYFVRELLDPDAFSQYGKISVDGTSQTTNYDVTVGTDSFKGVDSPLKDVSDGSTSFNFDNQITFNKLGALEITKQLETYPQTRESLSFKFHVTVDGTALPAGTSYTVGSETRTVMQEGIIELAPGETARISNIIAGSQFTVQEDSASAAGYTVTYSGDGLTQGSNENGSFVSGTIRTASAVSVTAINSEKGASVTITGTKTLNNPDGKEHTCYFQLEQVADETGEATVSGGLSMDTFATVSDTATSFSFVLNYLEKDMTDLPGVFYYRITETADKNEGEMSCDPAVYIAQVTVSKNDDGSLSASLTGLWKNGAAVTDMNSGISFTNTLIGDLSIAKEVSGTDLSGKAFSFDVALKDASGNLIPGTYDAVRYDSEGAESQTEKVAFSEETGVAVISLQPGETLKICGIPYGTSWSVAEEEGSASGYDVSYSLDGNEVQDNSGGVSGTIECGKTVTVTVTNSKRYSLPQTGGTGTRLFTFGGIAIMAGALMFYILRRRKGEML